MFDALTEVKSEVECVIEAGNKIIELQQTDKPEDLKDRLLNLKVQYNFLGAEVNLLPSMFFPFTFQSGGSCRLQRAEMI